MGWAANERDVDPTLISTAPSCMSRIIKFDDVVNIIIAELLYA